MRSRSLKYVVLSVVVAVSLGSANAIDLHLFTAGDTILASEVNENFAELAAAIEGDKTLALPASALNHDPTSATVTPAARGLTWQATFVGSANLSIPRPTDWDGTSDVVLELYFVPTTSTAGNVAFFIRPRAYDIGELYFDAPSVNAPAVPAGGTNILGKQTFVIPATKFAAGELWVITLQREGTGETYPDDVILVSLSLTYTASY